MSKLEGKVALVTGGSRGIGAGIARALARAGADVAITYVSAAAAANEVVDELKNLGARAVAIQADAADAAAVKNAVEQTVAHLGRLDILVNNAGIYDGGPLEELTLEQIDRSLAVNVRAVIVGSQAAAKHMSRGGRIITIGSCLADRVPDPEMSLYSATKAAVAGFTRGLARDLGSRGITANVVSPGPIDTDMNPADGEFADHQRSKLALREYGTPDDIAYMVLHLASEAGRFITGTSITVDGGHNA